MTRVSNDKNWVFRKRLNEFSKILFEKFCSKILSENSVRKILSENFRPKILSENSLSENSRPQNFHMTRYFRTQSQKRFKNILETSFKNNK